MPMSSAAAGRVRGVLASEYAVLAWCGVAFLVFAASAPGFASAGNLSNIVLSALPLLLLATGQTLVLITGGIDLSLPAVVGLSSVAGGLLMSADQGVLGGAAWATPVGLAAMVATGALVGLGNGICIAGLRMPAFMVTLTAMMFYGGFALWLAQRAAGTETLYQLPAAFIAIGTHPWMAVGVATAAAVAAHGLLEKTLLGRWLFAAGQNPRAALLSGVPVGRVTVAAYVLSGMFAALAAVLLTARLETASPNHGKAMLLDVIGASVIGGASLFGGKGKIAWTAGGVLFLALLGNGLNHLNFSEFEISIVKGLVILAAALLDVWRGGWGRSG